MHLFISFEGGEGSGKSTQADLLSERLQGSGVKSVLVREPGSTEIGSEIRRWLKKGMSSECPISPITELLLFESARAELVTKVLRPILEQDDVVLITDRYADSTTAYQGYGRNLSLELVTAANTLSTEGLMPTLTFLLDCPPADGLERVKSRTDSQMDYFEKASLDFHTRVRDGYLTLASRDPGRWQVLDATKSQMELHSEIWGSVSSHLQSDNNQTL